MPKHLGRLTLSGQLAKGVLAHRRKGAIKVKPGLRDEVRDLLEREGWELGYRYVARKLGRNTAYVRDAMRELRAERDELGRVDPPLIPIDLSDFEPRRVIGDWKPTPIQCVGDPINGLDGARHTTLICGNNPTAHHIWERLPDRDGVHCIRCHLTFLGGPTVVVNGPPVVKKTSDHQYAALDCGSENERILALGDIHSPFHDKRAWDAMIKFAKAWRPHTILQVGDWSDFYCVSDHDKDPRRAHNLKEEAQATIALRQELDDLKPVRKFFDEGNHCYRLERYLRRAGGALLGAVSVESLLGFEAAGWRTLPYMSLGRIGNLHHTHDVGKCGKDAVRQTAQLVGGNIIFGHAHILEQIYFGNMLGDRYTAACIGWLGDVSAADYMNEAAKARWQHGFATALMEKTGDFNLQLWPIVGGRVIGG